MIIDMTTHRPHCSVAGCNTPAYTLASGLCVKHYARQRKHGTTADPAPSDNKREHPLFQRWAQLKRRELLAPEWKDDFWAFVSSVSPKPDWAKKLGRPEADEPYGPSNFVWSKTPSREDNLAYFKEWNRKNPEYRRSKHLEEKYGITLDDYNEAFERQGGCCAICNSPGISLSMTGEGPKALAVDHDHHTDQVRDLLCDHCNRGLGYFEDNPALLEAAAGYILLHRPLPKVFQYPVKRMGDVPFFGLKIAEPGTRIKEGEVHLVLSPHGIKNRKR